MVSKKKQRKKPKEKTKGKKPKEKNQRKKNKDKKQRKKQEKKQEKKHISFFFDKNNTFLLYTPTRWRAWWEREARISRMDPCSSLT
jgi:hypothetical protein